MDGLVIGGKYRLKKLIGAGGMGQVWVARNTVTDRDFAIKLLLPQAATNEQVVARFVREAKISGRLRHPGILEIYDAGTAPELYGAPFLVMELLEGVSLEDAIRARGGLPLRFTLLVAVAVARALVVAHEKGVVHRDLKPANVFLHRDDAGAVVPKLLDFGISKLSAPDATGSDAQGLTQTGAVLGSPRYMSPEQIASEKDIDGRSDLHALGVLVWWCLVARSPFEVEGLHNVLLAILAERRPRLLDALPDVPPGVSAFVDRAFARRREDRYATAREALAVLEQELAKLGPGPTLESRAWADELLAGISAPKLATPAYPLVPPAKESTTHGAGAVSVSLAAGAPLAPPSPAAHTMPSVSAGVTPPEAARPGRAAVATVVAGLVAAAAVGAGFLLTRSQPPRVTAEPTASGAAASPSPPPHASTVTAATTAPAPTPSASAEPASAPLASATPSAAPPPARSPRPPRASPPPRSTAAPAASAADPFRGVTGTGL